MVVNFVWLLLFHNLDKHLHIPPVLFMFVFILFLVIFEKRGGYQNKNHLKLGCKIYYTIYNIFSDYDDVIWWYGFFVKSFLKITAVDTYLPDIFAIFKPIRM